jgi:hypothetical protein
MSDLFYLNLNKMNCFDNIIGFTETQCNCFTAEELGGDVYKLSNSGLYMDSLEETKDILKTLKASADCGKTLGDLFSSARKNAIASFKERVLLEMGTRFTVKYQPYSGVIGQVGITGALNSVNNYIGSVYEMNPLRGGIFKVNKLYVGINTTMAVDVMVYKAYIVAGEYELQGDPIQTIQVNAVANQVVTHNLQAALELPLTDSSNHVIHYLFLMDRGAGNFQAMDLKASCGCGEQDKVSRWLTQGGIEGMDINHLQTSLRKTGKGSYANGIVVEADIMCSDTSFVCDAYYGNPFIRTAIEHAILFQAGSNILSGILRRDAINRFTLTRREEMKTDSAILHNNFKSRVTWIAENIDMRENNCFICNTVNEVNGPYKSGIRF